jgi:uncharacterized protein YacL
MFLNKNNGKRNRQNFLNIFYKIKIKSSNFSFSDLTILIWIWLFVFSIFIPWFTLPYNWVDTQWFFSKIIWIVWYITILLIIINIFIIFSKNYKEKIKLFFNSKLKDKHIFIFSAILFLILWLNSITTIKWLELLNSEIKYHNWIIFYIIAWIIYSFWILFKIKEKEKISNFISMNESKETEINNTIKKEEKKNVMKLPFE